MLDHFLQNLFEQYKELGLYEDTIFVLYGDHGEGFREHGRYMHGDNPYEEGLWIPMLIHAPGWFEGGERAKGLASQIDILPTVLDMLGYEVSNGNTQATRCCVRCPKTAPSCPAASIPTGVWRA